MALDFTPQSVSTGYLSIDALDENFESIESALTDGLSRSGDTPNEMNADLDMNSNDILNTRSLNVQTLSINGTQVTAGELPATEIPDQGGHSGKYLSTNGTATSWAVPASSQVSHLPQWSGATSTTVRSKLQERVSIKDFGAVGDNSTDDTAAIQAAIDYLRADTRGGVVFVPRGIYNFTSLDLNDITEIKFLGEGSASTGSAITSTLYCTLTTSAAAIDAQSSRVSFENMGFLVASPLSYTGTFINLGRYAAGSNGDSVFTTITDCSFYASSGVHTFTYIDLDECHTVRIERCQFASGGYHIKGQASSGSFSNNVLIRGCYFGNSRNVPIVNGGDCWTIENCTFEAYNNGTGGTAVAGAFSSSMTMEAFAFRGNWMGDTDTAGGTWLSLTSCQGFDISNNWFATHGTGSNGVQLTSCSGGSVRNNHFDSLGTAVAFVTSAVQIDVSHNTYNSVTAKVGNTSVWSEYNADHCYLPNFAVQAWGRVAVTAGGSAASVSLPVTLTAAPEVITCTIDTATNADQMVYVSNESTTGFDITVTGTSGSVGVYWMAIGKIPA